MKILSITVLTILFMLTGCENPLKRSVGKPSKGELQEAIFEDAMPFLNFHQFECRFENHSEASQENQYQVYISTVFSYNEPLYIDYKLNDPWYYKEKGLEALAALATQNNRLKNSGKKGLSPILWKIHEKGEKFKMIILVDILKIEKQWICSSFKLLSGEDVEGEPASFFPLEYLIYGSREHLEEMQQYGIEFPDIKI